MIYFTSDTHFCHAKILTYCPNRKFASVSEMDEALIANYNAVVTDQDIVFHLGDVAFGQRHINIPAFVPRLKGHKHLLLGNHDTGFGLPAGPAYQQAIKMYLAAGFHSVRQGIQDLDLWLNMIRSMKPGFDVPKVGFDIQLCHFPYRETEAPIFKDKYFDLRPHKTEALLLHGHTHAVEPRTDFNLINVGVDSWGMKPVSVLDVLGLFAEPFTSVAESLKAYKV